MGASGIGMTKNKLVESLGTVAMSDTAAFKEATRIGAEFRPYQGFLHWRDEERACEHSWDYRETWYQACKGGCECWRRHFYTGMTMNKLANNLETVNLVRRL